jgi:hypothetical protein
MGARNLLRLSVAQSLTRLAAPSEGQAGSTTSVAGENVIAFDLDRLFRSERRNTDLEYPRAEAARVLLTTSSHRGIQPEDRAYLVRLTALYTGLAQPDAERRVDDVAARQGGHLPRASQRRDCRVHGGSRGAARGSRLLVRSVRRRARSATAKLHRTRCCIGESRWGEPERDARARKPTSSFQT